MRRRVVTMGRRFFLVKAIVRHFWRALCTVRQRYPFSLYGYALMPNHLNLLLEVHRFQRAHLQSLLTGYARRFANLRARDDRREQHPPSQAAT